jgi:hypothetical protein
MEELEMEYDIYPHPEMHMTKKGSHPKAQRPQCFNTKVKQGYCGPCIWNWKCGNKRKN